MDTAKSLGFIALDKEGREICGYQRSAPTIFKTRKLALAQTRYAADTREVFYFGVETPSE